MNTEALSRLPVPAYHYHDSVPSTNDLARDWAESGAPDGAIVITDEQTAGRGRMSRRWLTPPGCALALSLVLHPTAQEMTKPALFSPLGGLALAIALEERYTLTPEIKWPNDVLLNGRKTSGILAESLWQDGAVQAVILGIGVNVAPPSVPPADQVQFPATCVETAAGRPVDRINLLDALLHALFYWRARLTTPAFLHAWEKRLAFMGEPVQLTRIGQPPITGRLTGITPLGELRLTMPNGEKKNFPAGDLHLRRIGKNPVQ